MDINNVEKAFLDYVEAYDRSDEKVELKVIHTQHVAKNAMRIAKLMKLSDEDISLAYTIGILHDIGRFEQLRRYHTFFDADSVNHALLGIELLKSDNLLSKLCGSNKDEELIYTAIRNHNCYRIEAGLSKREQLHTTILRDGDKADIFQVHLIQSCESILECTKKKLESEFISQAIYEDFMLGKAIDSKKRNTHADILISHLAMLFDVVHPESLQLIQEQGHYEALLEHYSFQDKKTNGLYLTIKEKALDYFSRRNRDAK